MPRSGRDVKCYAVRVLPQLTDEELTALAEALLAAEVAVWRAWCVFFLPRRCLEFRCRDRGARGEAW